MKEKEHVLVKMQDNEKDNERYWYDNPDFQDLLTAYFNEQPEYQEQMICTHNWNPKKEIGLHQLKVADTNNGIMSVNATKVTDIKDKILYAPILSLNNDTIPAQLDNLLKGYLIPNDQGKEYQKPKFMLIPVLMHYNHFGLISINFEKDPQKPEIEFFNPKGNESSYKDNETKIKTYFESKQLKFVQDPIKCQSDGNSCGPFVIQRTIQTTTAVIKKAHLNDNELCNLPELALVNQVTDAAATKKIVAEYRKPHSEVLKHKPNNYSLPLMLTTKHMLANIENEQIPDKLTIKIPLMAFEENEKGRLGRRYKLHERNILEVDGIDIFEASPVTAKFMLVQNELDKFRKTLDDFNNVEEFIKNFDAQKGQVIGKLIEAETRGINPPIPPAIPTPPANNESSINNPPKKDSNLKLYVGLSIGIICLFTIAMIIKSPKIKEFILGKILGNVDKAGAIKFNPTDKVIVKPSYMSLYR